MNRGQAQNQNGEPLTLVLYKSDSCFFCLRVFRAIESLGIPVELRDIRQSSEVRRELVELGGKPQVPCLSVNGRPMYESSDIVTYLQEEVVVV